MVTYTLNLQPVSRARYDGASDTAKLMAEVFERLTEIEEERLGSAGNLVRRLATLADLSPRGFLLVLRFGSGDTGALLASYEQQADGRALTRQALHWQWQQDVKAIRLCFPEVAQLLVDYRQSIKHQEDAMSSADGLRAAMEDGRSE